MTPRRGPMLRKAYRSSPFLAERVSRVDPVGVEICGVESRKLMGEPRKGVERPKNGAHKWPLVRFFEAAGTK
jgi:hypothetical protein